MRVALDLLGGDAAPGPVVDGALLVLAEQPDVDLVLVGPPEVAARLPVDGERLTVVPATEVVGMDEEPARAVRAKRDATVRVCARLVRDGSADAMVSLGSTGATLAAAVLTLHRLKGVSRPPLAAVVPALAGPVVFLDAGATVEASPELLASFALVGAAYAAARGVERPRVGLLTVGEEAGKGDLARKAAHEALSALPVDFVGNVEGRDVPTGGRADVVVTDGFTGNVLAKGLEAAAGTVTATVRAALASRGDVPDDVLDAVDAATGHMSPEVLGGAVLLGVRGVVVVGHGASTPRGVASCVRAAADAARSDLVGRTARALEALVPAVPQPAVSQSQGGPA
ncbi:MAG TPA: phosphate acyltransferase PlsX [Mycobacteriales bacterium]|nr:phosphate acyltransferase PlsX [Mycobacteriales bacterium]